MKENKPKILIGSITNDDFAPMSTITRAFINNKMLRDKYDLQAHYAFRKYGKANLAKLNLINLYYLIKHYFLWLYKNIVFRPSVVHYPITSFWNLEKSLLFLLTGGILGAKKVGQLHGGAFIDFWNGTGQFRKYINLKFLNSLDVLVVSSKYWKKMVEENCGVKTKIEIIPNPIEQSFESKFFVCKDRKVGLILFMGRIDTDKGVLDIVKSAEVILKTNDCKFVLAGIVNKVKDYQQCLEIIKHHNLESNVVISGEISENEKIKLFSEASIFLFPSYFENFPLVIIEAACAGLPIITTRVGALPGFFENERSVIFVEPGNIEQIKNAVVDLLNNPEKRKRLGKGARQVFEEKLSRDNIMNQLDEVYRNVLSN